MERERVEEMTAREPAPGTPREGAGIGAAIEQSAQRLKEVRQGVESFLDPFGMVAPIVHAHTAWGLHPMEFAELAMRYAADLTGLQLNLGSKFLGRETPDAVQPQHDDERFSDPVWSNEPGWDALKQWYLFSARHMQDALHQTPGLSFPERRRAAFWWRNWPRNTARCSRCTSAAACFGNRRSAIGCGAS